MTNHTPADDPVTMTEAPTSEQAKRRKEQATITGSSDGSVSTPSLDLDDDKLEQAQEDVDYVNDLLNGDF